MFVAQHAWDTRGEEKGNYFILRFTPFAKHFILKFQLFKGIKQQTIYQWIRKQIQDVWTTKKQTCRMHRLTTKKLTVRQLVTILCSPYDHIKLSLLPPFTIPLSPFSHASSDPDTSLSDSYSATTYHPSLLFLVFLLSFCRFPIKRFLAACVLAALDFNTNEDGVQLAFSSNGFWYFKPLVEQRLHRCWTQNQHSNLRW